MNIEQAAPILQDIIRTGKKHKDYDHVCKRSKLYKQLITGKDSDKLIRQFVRREDDVQFEQRVRLTQLLTMPVAEAVMNPFYRVGRLDNIKKSIRLEGEATDQKIALVEERIASYFGHESLDKYLSTRFVQLSFTDPNAFIVTDFAAFDNIAGYAKPYPVEVSCEQAWNFQYKNNILDWLVACIGGNKFIMYLENSILQYKELKDDESANGGLIWMNPDNNKRYLVEVFNPKGGEVQAVRIGYKLDMETEGRTFVNPFHAAIPYFMKSIKAVSEMDLTMSLHAFPQKSQFAEACEGHGDDYCNNGKDENGNNCKACKGTGVKVITTAQDVLLVPKPDLEANNGNYIKLSEMVDYKSPDVELLKFQDAYVDKLEAKVIAAVYNSDILSKTTVSQTATERIEKKDEMYNTLQPFAEQYATVWKHKVRVISMFVISQKPYLVYEFPKDFKLKTTTELMIERKAAIDSGSPSFVIQAIDEDIARKIFVDDDHKFLKFSIKNKFTPFLGKTIDEIKFILTSGYARLEDQILYTHTDTIFDELEQEVKGFFEMSYELQNKHVTDKIKKIADGLPKDTLAIDFRDIVPNQEEAGEATDVQVEAAAKLKGSVGGVQGILEVQNQVASGVTQYEAGLAILKLIYMIPEAEARELLGVKKELEAATPEAV